MAPQPSRPIITLEEHFLSQVAATNPSRQTAQFKSSSAPDNLWEKFTELGPKRLEDMDAGQVTLQIISHGPESLDAEQCRQANDQLAAAVAAHPSRFAGFADLPMGDAEEAAAELRRTCGGDGIAVTIEQRGTTTTTMTTKNVKFLGALIDNHHNDSQHQCCYYDDPAYDVLWRTASEDLDVPIYLHPTWPSDDAENNNNNNSSLPDAIIAAILSYGFGWHSDVAMHILRLYAAGVFDKFPRLKIIIGHMGEMIPYMLQRIERVSARWGLTRTFREVWDSNIWVTTSGNWSLDPMACLLRNTKRDRIMYSVDYPFAKSEDGLRWLQELEESGMVTWEELEGIRWRNAAKFLKLDIKAA